MNKETSINILTKVRFFIIIKFSYKIDCILYRYSKTSSVLMWMFTLFPVMVSFFGITLKAEHL